MRVVQINSFGHLSTGSVMRKNHWRYLEEGDVAWMIWGRTPSVQDERCEYRFGNKANVHLDGFLTRIDGKAGFHSKSVTRDLLQKLDEIDPDVVHLHNLHGYYVNVEMLFDWLASHRCKVEWTLHDCWAFTGHCAYFTYAKCAQWQSHCAYSGKCPQIDTYPKTISQKTVKWNYEHKRRLFTMIPRDRMTIITPSRWLSDLVKLSFLSKYPIEVCHNEVDKTIFKPTASDFRQKYGIQDRFMVLGVASTWTDRKGLIDLMRLSSDLGNHYAVVIIGLSEKQIRKLPKEVIGFQRTKTPEELAAIYTAADVFFNPTREENYPTVNLEAEACGTPVVTYDTGGCSETIYDMRSRLVSCYDEAVERILDMREEGKSIDG